MAEKTLTGNYHLARTVNPPHLQHVYQLYVMLKNRTANRLV